MSTTNLVVRQTQFELRTFFRNHTGALFTIVFPIMFLILIGAFSHGTTTQFRGQQIPAIQFLLPGIMCYALTGACYTSLAMRITNLRDSGVLKRVAGTPLPRWAYVAGHLFAAIITGFVVCIVTVLIAVLFLHAHVYLHTLPSVIVTLFVASAAFCSLGLLMASVIPNADAAPGIVQTSILPLLFISDVWYSIDDTNQWLKGISNAFPVRHVANSLQIAFNPSTHGSGFDFGHLGIIALWGVLGTFLVARTFRWETKKG